MTRVLAFVDFAGGSLKFAWLALPHDVHVDDAGVAAMGLVAWLCGALLLLLPPRLTTDRVLNAAVAIATLEISGAMYFAHDARSDFGFFYVWVVPYAFFFFKLRDALLQTAWAGVCLAVVLASTNTPPGVALAWYSQDTARWVVVVGTLLIVGMLVRRVSTWLQTGEQFLRQGFEESALGMTLASRALQYVDVNPAYCRLLGRSRDDVIGLRYEDVTHPDDFATVREEALLAWSDKSHDARPIEKRLVRPDGSAVPVVCYTAVLRDVAGRARLLYTQVEDVTERRRREVEAARRTAQQAAIARLGEVALREEEIGDLIGEVVRNVTVTLDLELCIVVELSPDGEDLVADFGGKSGLLARRPVSRDSLGAFAVRAEEPVVVEDLREETRFAPSRLLTEHGAVSGVAVRIGDVRSPTGVLGAFATEPRRFSKDEITFLQAVANVVADALQRNRNEDATRHAALHDPLTGLPNRTLVLDRIEHALDLLRREDTTVAVIVLDLDRFKIINDSLGHAAGDTVLLTIAPRLREAVRPEDTVGRLGGDEFTVVCERVNGPHDAIALAERIETAIHRPIMIDSGEHFLSASIGIALTTTTDETPDALLRDADAAMYRAKDRGRGGYEIFDEAMRSEVLARLRTETELRRAIHAGDLRVHYQPIVDLESVRPVSVEALVRWQQPDGSLLQPDDFIPVAEESGLIGEVGLWVLGEACRQVATWQREFGVTLRLAVNASGRQLADPAFPAQVAQVARRSGLVPGSLALEITESVLVTDARGPASGLSRLREHGLSVLLDDFGTGYSSLAYLKRLPLDTLKVDRTFVHGLGVDPDDSAIVAAVIGLADSLGLDAVAEGVETDAQFEILRRLACRHGQGFLFAHPLPAEDCTAFLASHAV